MNVSTLLWRINSVDRHKFMGEKWRRPFIGCLKTQRTHVTLNISTTNNVVFFFV